MQTPSPSTSASRPRAVGASPRRHGLRRRTLSALGVSLFLSGLLFGEAIEAVAALDAPVEVAATEPTGPDPAVSRAVTQAQAASSARAVEALSVAALNAMHDQLLALAPEGIDAERREIWRDLADCESGDWYRGVPMDDSRRWDSTAGFFEGGLQFHPGTWDGFRDEDMPDQAYDATPIQQMVVAERVLEAQGWKAWPVCSRKLGYR